MERIKYTAQEVVDLQLLKKTKPWLIILWLNKDWKTYSFYTSNEITNLINNYK